MKDKSEEREAVQENEITADCSSFWAGGCEGAATELSSRLLGGLHLTSRGGTHTYVC